MAAEARAMLDALMGQDRNASIVTASSTADGNQDWDSLRKKKSCYDRDVCPLYCAWGVDVYELFTNTKSDLGPNPYQVRDDAREEYLSLPEHEKERLGFEHMLHRKLGELVRSCDRIVSRNKEKLRQEIAQAAKKRGANTNRIDPVTDVSNEMICEAAEIMADLELQEDQVRELLKELMNINVEWKELWNELQMLFLKQESNGKCNNIAGESSVESDNSRNDDVVVADAAHGGDSEIGTDTDHVHGSVAVAVAVADTNRDVNNDPETKQEPDGENISQDKRQGETGTSVMDEERIQNIKSRLYALSSEQQKIIGKIANMTTQTIVPLRDSLQNLTKQLYYVKTDMSEDKTVCEVSGNFMSFRDAEERIAAHYAGKQYVGWKMVREKFKELDQKARNWRPTGSSIPGGVPPPGIGRYDSGGSGGGGGSHNARGGGYGPPARGHGYPPPVSGHGGHSRNRDRGYGRGHGSYGDRSDRSRSRDRDSQRWERDRGPPPPRSGGGDYRRGERRGWR